MTGERPTDGVGRANAYPWGVTVAAVLELAVATAAILGGLL